MPTAIGTSTISHIDHSERAASIAQVDPELVGVALGYLGQFDRCAVRLAGRVFSEASSLNTTLFLSHLRDELKRIDPEGYKESWEEGLDALNETDLTQIPPKYLAYVLRFGIFERMDPEKFKELKGVFSRPKTRDSYTDVYLVVPKVLKRAFDLDESVEEMRSGHLFMAAEKGIIEYLRMMNRIGVPFECVADRLGGTPAHYAASAGQVETLRVLIEELGVNPKAVDRFGATLLHTAAEWGHVEVIRYLHRIGIDLNAVDSFRKTPAHLAAQRGNVRALKVLGELGADLNAAHIKGETPAD